MSDGRTVWWGKDAGWWRRERIVELGEEFGPGGPAVVDWLTCEAKVQNDGGYVKSGQKSIARGVFMDAVTVGHVLSRAVALGLLDEFEEDAGLFTCRISGWRVEQERYLAANRKANQRAKNPIDPDDPSPLSRTVTDSHGESRPVPKCPPTGQDSVNGSSTSAASRAEKEAAKASDDDRRNCRLFGELALQRNPKVKIPKAGSGAWAEWLRSMRLLREADDNTAAEIERVIRWVFTDPSDSAVFWATTIQAPSGLREHFAQIWAKMTSASGPGLRAVPPPESSAAYLARREARKKGAA